MAISIHIDDVTSEDGPDLYRLGKFLIEASGQVAAPAPLRQEVIDAWAKAEDSQRVDTSTGEITAHPGVAPLIPVPPPPADTHGSPELDADAEKLTAIFGAGAAGPTIGDLTPPPPPPPPPGVTVDSAGFPWDSRIHSAKRSIIANGTWKYRRNVDDALVAQVEAELRQTMGVAPAPLNIIVTGASIVDTLAAVPPPPAAAVPPPPSPPPAAVPPPPPPPPAADAPNLLPAFMEWAVQQSTAGRIPGTMVLEMAKAHGLPHIGALFNRQDLIPVIRAEIEAHIAKGGAA